MELSDSHASRQTLFYQFLGAHSLLIGLFPFFIPVWLWNERFSLASICLFIAGSGIFFCIALRSWEEAANRLSMASLLLITFILELFLLAVAKWLNSSALFLCVLALANGFYNCFFWTTQRTLFLQLVNTENSGRQYGNFQIFVMVFLKAGILCGGLLLEHSGLLSIVLVSAALTSIMSLYFFTQAARNQSRRAQWQFEKSKPVGWLDITGFKDKQGSRRMFVIDGLFLFFESHLWTISLFFLSRENFASFGIAVIALAVFFSVLFLFTKNTIDKFAGTKIFSLAISLYSLGWLLRALIDSQTPWEWMILSLLLITFFTSFFRLAFNKRFYDVAKQRGGRHYLIIKSYYTQASVSVIFATFGLLAMLLGNSEQTLQLFYAVAAILSLLYFGYRNHKQAVG